MDPEQLIAIQKAKKEKIKQNFLDLINWAYDSKNEYVYFRCLEYMAKNF